MIRYCVLVLVAATLLGCQSANRRESSRKMMADRLQRDWPPETITITRKPKAHPAIRIDYTVWEDGNSYDVVILTNSEELEFRPKEQAGAKGNAAVKRRRGLGPGDVADVLIKDGWLYIYGQKSSVGSSTMTAVPSSNGKLIVLENPGQPTRILHPATQGEDAEVWNVGPGNRAYALPPNKVAWYTATAPDVEPPDPDNDLDNQPAELSAACLEYQVPAPIPPE